jgi:outer membrane protein assembly factor BamA
VPQDANNPVEVGGIASTYEARSTGIGATLGRRLSDIVRVSGGINISQVASSAQVPAPYFFPAGTSTNILGAAVLSTTSSPLGSTVSGTTALGISAPSIAEIDSTKPYNLHALTFAAAVDTRDDVFNPRRGSFITLSDEFSGPEIGSDFKYSIYVLDAARFFPFFHGSTLGFHARTGFSTGAIPPNKLFTFSDQDLRGYSNPFYGTDELLFQTELRYPLTPDRKFSVVGFAETGAVRIRGAGIAYDTNGNPVNVGQFAFHDDVGVGLRFDVPQLGLRTIRLDFAKGSQGTHTAFGIGQSF